MSKELEALERGIIEFEKNLEDDPNNDWLKRTIAGMKKCYQRLEAIDNSNPSEALEKLDKVNNYLNEVYDYKEIKEEVRKDIDTIKHSLLRLDHLDDVLNVPPNRFSCINNREIIVMRTEMYEKYQEQEKLLDVIKEYQVDIWLLKQCDYENYIRIRKEAMVSIGEIVNENGITLEDEITEEYFDLVKRWTNESN